MTKKTKINSLLFAAVMVAAVLVASPVFANSLENQINDLKKQNEQTNAANQVLELEEQSLQATVDRLRSEITSVQKEIDASTARIAELRQQILDTEKKIAEQKNILSDVIVSIYLNDSITPVEMLASSKSISDFIDKQEYKGIVSSKLHQSIQNIKKLEQELNGQKKSTEQALADQQAMQSRLVNARSEQDQLLSFNQDQQAAYESQLQQNNAKIAELRRQQAAENARLSGGRPIESIPDTSGYPWANVPFPSYVTDPWGMYLRQCVSYTAWKVWKSGRYMPYWGGVGNANQWDDNARQAGIPVDRNPRVGDVAVWPVGRYGHVMYVEAVGGDGSLYVSDYNQQFDGNYREYWISASSAAAKDLVFIHF